jgi:uncharacterized protein (DUF302 family)
VSIETSYTFGTRLPGTIADIRPIVEAALRVEGFGILTEIDVQATLKARLGVDRAPYLILGACNPPLAHRALEADPSVGALLPCNIVLREDGPVTIVEALDPLAALGIVDAAGVRPVAEEAKARLARAIAALETRALAPRSLSCISTTATARPSEHTGRSST